MEMRFTPHPAPLYRIRRSLVQSEEDPDILPLSTRRAPGRPKKRRICGQHDEVDHPKRVFTTLHVITRCKGSGHSKRTCRAGLNTIA
jgi:hypothetical protein